MNKSIFVLIPIFLKKDGVRSNDGNPRAPIIRRLKSANRRHIWPSLPRAQLQIKGPWPEINFAVRTDFG